MKALTCEMCGSTDLIKQDGVFVCQQCGTKYSVEEARKMMVEGTVSVQGTVSVDNSNLLDNLYVLGRRAIQKESIEVVDYYKRILEIDPFSKEAVFVCDCFDVSGRLYYDKTKAHKYILELSNEEKSSYFEVLKDYYLDDCKYAKSNDDVYKAWGDLFVNFWFEHIDETLNWHYKLFIIGYESYISDNKNIGSQERAVKNYYAYCEHFTRLKEYNPSLDLHEYQAKVSEMEEKLKELDEEERKKIQEEERILQQKKEEEERIRKQKKLKGIISVLLLLAIPVIFIFGVVSAVNGNLGGFWVSIPLCAICGLILIHNF